MGRGRKPLGRTRVQRRITAIIARREPRAQTSGRALKRPIWMVRRGPVIVLNVDESGCGGRRRNDSVVPLRGRAESAEGINHGLHREHG